VGGKKLFTDCNYGFNVTALRQDARHRGLKSSWRVGEEEEEQCWVKGKRGEGFTGLERIGG